MASMDVGKRRAYLYQKAIELLFSPLDKKAQKQWIIAFGQSLHSFWQTDRAFRINAGKYEVEAYLLNIACSCDIREDGYFAVDYEILKEGFLMFSPGRIMLTLCIITAYRSKRFLANRMATKERHWLPSMKLMLPQY